MAVEVVRRWPSGRPLAGSVLLVVASLAAAHAVGLARPGPNVVNARQLAPDDGLALQAREAEPFGTASSVPARSTPEPPFENVPENLPEEWSSGGDHVLRVQKTKVPLPGAAENGGPREVEMLTYNGRLVGPTIRAERGSTLRITLINELPTDGEPPVTSGPGQEDPPHGLFTTNLHTHGLHVSPSGNSDNVFREVPPGTAARYEFSIPPDHPSGTFWYHPHKHGSVAYQLANGLAGALIVEGNERKTTVRDLDDVPEVAHARERVLVLQQLSLRTDEKGVGRVHPDDVYNPPDPGTHEVTTINGAVMPSYRMNPGEVERWRFIHAGRLGSTLLCWYDEKGQRVSRMYWHEVAVDGLATGKITTRYSVTLRPGNRSDVLFKAPSTRGTYYLTSMEEDEATGNEILTERYLARLVVSGPDRDMKLPSTAQLSACRPYQPIERAECTVKRDLVFDYDEKARIFHINGSSFSNQGGADEVVMDTAEEWTLTAANTSEASNEPHPFHVHVNPFQVVQIENLATGVVVPVNEWRDTVVLEKGKKLTIRLRFRRFAGKTVMHCHTLDHEDQGMMRAFQIRDPARAEGSDEPVAKLEECALPAPRLTLPTIEGPAWDLRSVGRRDVVLVFIRGLACTHCVQELRNLVRNAWPLVGTETAIVAVSSQPIANRGDAVASLGVPEDLDFHLLADQDMVGFRAFGCYDNGPLHGLFIIDRAGTIRARYRGEVPFADPPAVVRSVRQLGSPSWQRAL